MDHQKGKSGMLTKNSAGLWMQTSGSTSTLTYFIYGTTGGIIRLSPETPDNIRGVFTDSIASCLILVLIGKNGRVSFLHMPTPIDLPSVKSEYQWVGELKQVFIIYNPFHDPKNALSRVGACRMSLFIHAGITDVQIFKTEKRGIIGYQRYEMTCFIPTGLEPYIQYCPKLSIATFSLQDYFCNDRTAFLQYDCQAWREPLMLVSEAQAIYGEHELLLTFDTHENRTVFKDWMVQKATIEGTNTYLFEKIKELWQTDKGIAIAALDDLAKLFFLYAKEIKPYNHALQKISAEETESHNAVSISSYASEGLGL